jgi:hypothetical protein
MKKYYANILLTRQIIDQLFRYADPSSNIVQLEYAVFERSVSERAIDRGYAVALYAIRQIHYQNLDIPQRCIAELQSHYCRHTQTRERLPVAASWRHCEAALFGNRGIDDRICVPSIHKHSHVLAISQTRIYTRETGAAEHRDAGEAGRLRRRKTQVGKRQQQSKHYVQRMFADL